MISSSYSHFTSSHHDYKIDKITPIMEKLELRFLIEKRSIVKIVNYLPAGLVVGCV